MLPLGHGVHVSTPVLYWPAGQGVQLVWPDPEIYPDGHAGHPVAVELAYVPAPQVVQLPLPGKLLVSKGRKKYVPRTRIERMTFPLQVGRATTTPTRLGQSNELPPSGRDQEVDMLFCCLSVIRLVTRCCPTYSSQRGGNRQPLPRFTMGHVTIFVTSTVQIRN